MKQWMALLVMAVMGLALVTGCSAKHKADTAKLTKGFASASAELKAQVDTAVKAIHEQKYAEAVDVFEKMVDKGDLSADQKQALLDTLIDVQVLVTEKPPADSEALLQKMQDLQTKLM